MTKLLKSKSIINGLAMFSMFFGAGNVVFPLMLGNSAGDKNFFAISGLVITGIIVPFSGLIAMILFNGDYRAFFYRIGKIPGGLLILLTMALIGPFAGIPRCITLSHSTLTFSGFNSPLWLFSLIACLIIFLTTMKKSSIVAILGTVLTPLLILSLAIIIIQGIIASPSTPIAINEGELSVFLRGLKEGYNTLDLPAAFFFSTVVLARIKSVQGDFSKTSIKQQAFSALKSSLVGAGLLILIYVGLSYVASTHQDVFKNVNTDQILAAVALQVLGSKAGIIANLAVALACLTTAIVLSCIFADFIKEVIFKNKLGYIPCLIITLIIAWSMSELGFMNIIRIVAPIIFVCYPVFIAATYLNLSYKLWNFKPMRSICLIVFIISLIFFFL